MKTQKTILIADSNRRLGDLMGQLLDDDARFRVLGIVSTAAAALESAKANRPHVVLVSESLDGVRGSAVCSVLRRQSPTSALLLWTHDVAVTAAAAPDADALLVRGMTYEELAQAVRHASPAPPAPRQVLDLDAPAGTRQSSDSSRS